MPVQKYLMAISPVFIELYFSLDQSGGVADQPTISIAGAMLLTWLKTE